MFMIGRTLQMISEKHDNSPCVAFALVLPALLAVLLL
jgi:hypothetical protein